MTRVLLLGLFVAAAFAAPRREAEFPAQPSSGASHGPDTVSTAWRDDGAPKYSTVAAGTAVMPPSSVSGNAGWAVASLGASYLAVRLPRGTLVSVCGPGDCWTTRTTDYGPSSRITPPRVADIAVGQWQRVCGMSPSRGLCRVTIVRTPMGPATDLEEGS
jgi:hypothetical protein